jgi:hypothetical protein
MVMPGYTVAVWGERKANKLSSLLVKNGTPFKAEPMPNEMWMFGVENRLYQILVELRNSVEET